MSLHVNRLHKAPLTLVKLLYPPALKHRTPLFEAIFVIPYLAGPPCWTMSFVKLRLLASETQPNCTVCLWAFDRILNDFILIQGALDGLLHWLEIQIIWHTSTLQDKLWASRPLVFMCVPGISWTFQLVETPTIYWLHNTNLFYLPMDSSNKERNFFFCLLGGQRAMLTGQTKAALGTFLKELWEFCRFWVVLNTTCTFDCIWYSTW